MSGLNVRFRSPPASAMFSGTRIVTFNLTSLGRIKKIEALDDFFSPKINQGIQNAQKDAISDMVNGPSVAYLIDRLNQRRYVVFDGEEGKTFMMLRHAKNQVQKAIELQVNKEKIAKFGENPTAKTISEVTQFVRNRINTLMKENNQALKEFNDFLQRELKNAGEHHRVVLKRKTNHEGYQKPLVIHYEIK